MADSVPDEPDARVLGLKPWFVWPLSRWRWLTKPVRAERLAALRIGLALVMLLDVLLTLFLPSGDLFGPDSLGEPHVFSWRYLEHKKESPKRWSLLRNEKFEKNVEFTQAEIDREKARIKLLFGLWLVASLCLLIGLGARLAAAVCWAMSVSVAVSNSYIDNAGDTVRTLTLFYLMLCPCGAAWSVDAWLRRRFYWSAVRGDDGAFRGLMLMRRDTPSTEPFYVHPWALRLMFVQMMMIYLFNGLYKATGQTWHTGESLYDVLADLTLSRWSYSLLPLNYKLTQILTWTVLWWEVLIAPLMLIPWRLLADGAESIPYFGWLHVLFRWNREILLGFGAAFHVGILTSMEIGGFALYMLCLYLPLLPWERWTRRRPTEAPAEPAPTTPG